MAKTILAIIEKIAACFKNFGVTNTLLSLLIALIIIVGGLELWNVNTDIRALVVLNFKSDIEFAEIYICIKERN